MEKSQPFAVKLTDTNEKPVKRPGKTQKLAEKVTGASHQERMQAFKAATNVEKPTKVGGAQITVEKSLGERAKEMFSNQSTGVTAKRLEIEGLKSIAERRADLQQSIKAQAETRQAVQVGSIKNKIEEFKVSAEAPKASRSSDYKVEGQISFQERVKFLQQPANPSAEDGKSRPEATRTGKVGEIAAMLQQKKELSRQTVAEDCGSISERREVFFQALKGGSAKQKEVVIEGVPSVKDRVSLLSAKSKEGAKGEEVKERLGNAGLVKDRISMFTSGKPWRKEEDSEEEEQEEGEEGEEEEEEEEEVQLQTRKAKAQQSLLTKYADRPAPKALQPKRKPEDDLEVVKVRVEEDRQDEERRGEDGEKLEADDQTLAAHLQSDRTNEQGEPAIAEPLAAQLEENEENPPEEQAEGQARLLLEVGEVQQRDVENPQEDRDEEFREEEVVSPAAELVPERVGEAAEPGEIEANEQPGQAAARQVEPGEPQADPQAILRAEPNDAGLASAAGEDA